jgi:hypothetical protein
MAPRYDPAQAEAAEPPKADAKASAEPASEHEQAKNFLMAKLERIFSIYLGSKGNQLLVEELAVAMEGLNGFDTEPSPFTYSKELVAICYGDIAKQVLAELGLEPSAKLMKLKPQGKPDL